MNVKFNYLYRDGANYKNFNSVIFKNSKNLQIGDIDASVRSKLIDGTWFFASNWKIPDMHFKECSWDSQIDHEWHEFESVEVTMENVTEKDDIADFVDYISTIGLSPNH